jgi:hypothetical protein
MTSTPSENEQTQTSTTPTEQSAAAVVVAGPGSYYRNTRYLMTVILIGMGLWFGYDGFVGWPKSNEMRAKLESEAKSADARGDRAQAERLIQEAGKYKAHTPTDIRFQKVLCFILPPVAIVLLIRSLRQSRGEYRLEGTTLHVPGHPAVPFENITEIDKRLWDRKGIAYVSYDLGNGEKGKLKLDDFLYDRPPTDEIYERIEKYVTPAAESTSTSTQSTEQSQEQN